MTNPTGSPGTAPAAPAHATDRQVSDRRRLGRIVSVLTTSERGGAEYANVDMLDALAERGQEVALLTNVPDLAQGTRVPVRELDLGPKLSRRTVLSVVLKAPLIVLRLARALRAERPVGVVVAHFKKEQLLCSLLPRRLAPAIVWAEWGPVPPAMRSGPARWCYALAARRALRVFAVSEGTRRSVIEAGVPPAKVVVIPNLVDVHAVEFDAQSRERLRSEWGAGERTLVVGCISRFQKRKRNDVVIDAMAHLDGDVLQVMAGEGEEEAALRERAGPFAGRVRFAPNVRGHVEEFLSACDLLVFAPSPTEGEPRVIVMAQLVGVPVVATHPEGAEGLITPGAGTIVSPSHDPAALAATLAEYRDDRERCGREGAAARQATLVSHEPERTLRAVERVLDPNA
jgi:glycosyltransferase involved in cell wall biosynthesis